MTSPRADRPSLVASSSTSSHSSTARGRGKGQSSTAKARAEAAGSVSLGSGSTSCTATPTPERNSAATRVGGLGLDTSGSSVTYHADTRHYVVLANPRDPSFEGWTSGPAKTTRPRLEARLPGGQLSGSAVRLRRVSSKAEAEELWRQHRAGDLPTLPL